LHHSGASITGMLAKARTRPCGEYNMEAIKMPSAQKMIGRQLRFCFGITLAAGLLLSLPVVRAQYPLQYPAKSEVSKDGTAILIEG
jgi:hypothetical protein